jgi:arginyl-tRNA synthetase
MSIVSTIKPLVVKALKELYAGAPKAPDSYGFKEDDLTVSITKPEFEGDYTLVLFSFVKQSKSLPDNWGRVESCC